MNDPKYPGRNEPVTTPMSAFPFIPDVHDWDTLSDAARRCKGCPLYARATQTVFGTGPKGARIMIVGEQPGDKEDKVGKPFVGPAGNILDKALSEAGIDRDEVYVTNAVKHFKWEESPNGDRRLHAKPNRREVLACRPWLEAEIDTVRPEKILCLGATAAQSLLGEDVTVTEARGQEFRNTSYAHLVMVTVHPSSILRLAEDDKDDAFQTFVSDLQVFRAADP
jgi:DNA polymerase